MAEVDSSKKPIACNKDVIVQSADRKWPSSHTGGVKPMSIQGRLWRERQRLAGCGMSEQEREWRKQWIRDQQLSKNEPKSVPEIRRELLNPIRRFYRYPMDCFERFLAKNCGVDWTRKGGWRVVRNRPAVVPGDPNWPYKPERSVGADYADHGFKDSPIQKPLDVPKADHVVVPKADDVVVPKADDVVHRLDAHREEDIELSAKDLEDIFNYKDEGE